MQTDPCRPYVNDGSGEHVSPSVSGENEIAAGQDPFAGSPRTAMGLPMHENPAANEAWLRFTKKKGEYPHVTALICTLNEARNLPHVLPRIPDWVDEILLVDGHSTDGTVAVAKQFCPEARILHQPGKGKGDALRHGIQEAFGDIVVMLDADGSMNPCELPLFVRPLLDGYDFVKGSRFTKSGGTSDMERHRVFGNWCFTTLTNLLHGTHYTDLCYGYNAFWREKFHHISFRSDGFEVETEINIKVHKAGLRVREVPSFEASRLNGKGNLRSVHDGWRILRTIFAEWLQGS